MKTDIPRCDGSNPPQVDPCALGRWTWHSLIGLSAPILDLGRTPEEAELRLMARLRTFFKTEMDPLPDDPETRTQDEIDRYRRGAILSASATTEAAAFQAWKDVCSLNPHEAFLRWREVFSAPTDGADLLLRLIGRPGDEEPPVRPRTRAPKRST